MIALVFSNIVEQKLRTRRNKYYLQQYKSNIIILKSLYNWNYIIYRVLGRYKY